MAKSMLWMPVINGTLCAVYIVVFLMLAQVVASTMLAWALVIAAAGVWFAVVSRRIVRDGIARTHQRIYAIIVLLVGCALVAIAARLSSGHAAGSAWTAHLPISPDVLLQILWQSRLKVALFAASLLLFLVLTARLPISAGARGILAGLPIAPLAGRQCRRDGADLSERLHISNEWP
jgi:hypothetical protein